jgi:hypothetical protein
MRKTERALVTDGLRQESSKSEHSRGLRHLGTYTKKIGSKPYLLPLKDKTRQLERLTIFAPSNQETDNLQPLTILSTTTNQP